MSASVWNKVCPKCGATDLRLTGGWLVRLFPRLLGLRKIRCRRCGRPFWGWLVKAG